MAKTESINANVLATFNTAEEALRIAVVLKRMGFDAADITVMSNKPAHAAVEHEGKRRASRIGAFAILGGMIGAALSLMLTITASRRMGLNVGGMPVVAPWAFAIIVFEMSALGAVLASVGRMIYEAGLLRRGALANYDEDVARGKIVVAVKCSDEEGAFKAKGVFAKRAVKIK